MLWDKETRSIGVLLTHMGRGGPLSRVVGDGQLDGEASHQFSLNYFD